MDTFNWAPIVRRAAVLLVALAVCLGAVLSSPADVERGYVSDTLVRSRMGSGVYIDGVFVAACADAIASKEAVDGICLILADIYGAPEGEHRMYNDVRYISGSYSEDAFVDSAGLLSLLGDNGATFDFTVKDYSGNDTGIELKVVTTAFATLNETVPHSTVNVETDLLPKGDSITVINGVDGSANNSYEYTYVNGMLSEAVLMESVVVTEPFSAEVWVGADSGATLMDRGELFLLPYDGRVTSWYGYRRLWGEVNHHNGLDLAGLNGGCYGDPIYAAADGIVSFADWNGGYGRKVVIDHSASVSTVYAHCSKLLVEEGQAVQKGELIALVGNSGKVTGAHLHFEVLVNGVKSDPAPFIDWSTYKGTLY